METKGQPIETIILSRNMRPTQSEEIRTVEPLPISAQSYTTNDNSVWPMSQWATDTSYDNSIVGLPIPVICSKRNPTDLHIFNNVSLEPERRQEALKRYLYRHPQVNVYVEHLDDNIKDDFLRQDFMHVGCVVSGKIMLKECRIKGYAFVCFTRNQATAKSVNPRIFRKKTVYVSLARYKSHAQIASIRDKPHRPVETQVRPNTYTETSANPGMETASGADAHAPDQASAMSTVPSVAHVITEQQPENQCGTQNIQVLIRDQSLEQRPLKRRGQGKHNI